MGSRSTLTAVWDPSSSPFSRKLGSRPGALIAGCWASLMSVGELGYIKSCSEIVGAAKKIVDAIEHNPALNSDLEVLGHPLVSVVAFNSKTLDVYDIADAMSARG